MNVLFTSPALFGEEGVYGGGERYALGLARAVADQLGGATLYAAGKKAADRREGALRIVVRPPRFYVRGQASNPFPRGLRGLVREADVVHCFQRHITMTTAAIVYARLSGIPVFVTDLGGGGWDLSSYVDTSRWCAGLLHLSRFAARAVGRESDPRDAVLYGGVDKVAPQSPASTAALFTFARRRTVLFVGRLYPHKGADVLIQAVDPSWEVVICGHAYDQRYLADLQTLATGKRVKFVLSASDDDLESLYARSAVVVVPSLGKDRYGGTTAVPELLGLVALEAAVRGIPVVASDIASLPEIVESDVTGLLVPPGDPGALKAALGLLLADEGRRARLGQAAATRATERFSWTAAATTAVEAYRRARPRKA